jgi:molecular chaperone GrpE
MNDPNPVLSETAAGASPGAAAGAAGDALAAAEAKAQANWDSYVRSVAEFDNYRKRMDREIDNARKYAVERFAQELLPVSDALEAGLKAPGSVPGTLLEGAQATLRELHRAFEKAGIKVIDPAPGQPFDPDWQEAMVAQESPALPPGSVVSVIQKGYSLNGRLLRPARVIVAKAPEQPGA